MKTRDVARKAIREQIARAALKRFGEQGFDRTTVEEIASDMGMSTRTYFRYFPSKDDVLLEPVHAFAGHFLASFARHLAASDVWSALGAGMEEALASCHEADPGHNGPALQLIVRSTPALLARQLEIMERLQMETSDLYRSAQPAGSGMDWSTANAIIRSGFACLQAIQSNGQDQSQDIGQALRPLMQRLRPAILNQAIQA